MAAPFVSALQILRDRWDALAERPAAACRELADADTVDAAALAASGEALVEARLAADLAARRTARGDEPLRVLDIGCGPGRLLPALARRADVVHGLDLSPRMVERARDLVGDTAGVRLLVGDGLTLNRVRSHRYDLIVAVDVVEELPGDRLRRYLLRQMLYRLDDGGILHLRVGGDGWTAAAAATMLAGLAAPGATVEAETGWLRLVRPEAAPRA